MIDVMDDVSIDLKSYVSFNIFLSESFLLVFISFLLDSIVACMMMKFFSDLLYILLLPFLILKLEV